MTHSLSNRARQAWTIAKIELRRDARDVLVDRYALSNGDGKIAVRAAAAAEGHVNVDVAGMHDGIYGYSDVILMLALRR